MVDVTRYGNRVTITATDGGDGVFVAIPNTDQTADLNAYLNTAANPQLQSGGVYRISTRPAVGGVVPPDLDLLARTGGIVEGNGATLLKVWDPTSDATVAATLTDVIRIRDWTDATIRNITVDYFPKTYAKGPVIATTGSTITFRPDGPIAFKNADKLEREDGLTGAITDWQVFRNNDRTSNPGPITDNGDGTYTFAPPSITATIASVDQYGSSTSPLVIYAPGNGITDGQQVTLNVPAGSSFYTLVNGNTYTANLGRYSDTGGDDDANSDYLRIYLLSGAPLDASGAQTFTSGTITGLGKPTWVAVGDVIKLNVRKRAGNIYNVYRTKRCQFGINVKQATGLVSGGLDNDDPTFERLSFEGGSAGGFLHRETRGTITFDGPATFRDMGDNAFNFPSTAWDTVITGYANVGGFAQITVIGWSTGDPGPNRPRRPSIGDTVEFNDPTGLAPVLRKVTATTSTTATFDGPLPSGYFPSVAASGGTPAVSGWAVVNRAYVHTFRPNGLITIDGCATAGCLIQTPNFDLSPGMVFRRVRAECIRLSSPSSARPVPYGWRDGGIFGAITMEYCGYKLYPSNGSGIIFRRMTSTGMTVTAAPTDAYTRIPILIARHIGYSVVRAFSTRVSIGVYYGEDVCQRSDPNANAFLNPTKTALYAGNNGVITVDAAITPPTTLTESGGTITLPSTSGGGTYTASNGLALQGSDFRLANAPATTLKGNATGASAIPTDLTPTQVKTLLALAAIASTGAYADLTGKPTLGTIASQDASNVSISGGSISGIVDLALADGGTGASTASVARGNLGAAASGANGDITALTALGLLTITTGTDLTMASNGITPTGSYHRVSTSTGSPEDLINITSTGIPAGFLLTLASNSGTATLRSTGNISLFGGDFVLFGNAAISLRWNGTAWMEQARTRRAGGISRLTIDQATTTISGTTPEFVYLEGSRAAARTYNLSVAQFQPGDAIEFYNATTGGFSMTIRNNATAATIGTIAPGKAFRAKFVDSTIGFVPFFTTP